MDATISTEALRVLVGLGPVLRRYSRDPETGEDRTPYVSLHEAYALTGVKEETLLAHQDGLARLGVEIVERGTPGVMHAAEGGGRGEATAWAFHWPRFKPMTTPAGVGPFLAPSARLWSRAQAASGGWRMALRLIGEHGLEDAHLSVRNLAAESQKDPSTVSRALTRLERETKIVRKSSGQWRYEPLLLRQALPGDLGAYFDLAPLESRERRLASHADWKSRREQHQLKQKSRRLNGQNRLRAHLGLPPLGDTVRGPAVEHEVVCKPW